MRAVSRGGPRDRALRPRVAVVLVMDQPFRAEDATSRPCDRRRPGRPRESSAVGATREPAYASHRCYPSRRASVRAVATGRAFWRAFWRAGAAERRRSARSHSGESSIPVPEARGAAERARCRRARSRGRDSRRGPWWRAKGCREPVGLSVASRRRVVPGFTIPWVTLSVAARRYHSIAAIPPVNPRCSVLNALFVVRSPARSLAGLNGARPSKSGTSKRGTPHRPSAPTPRCARRTV